MTYNGPITLLAVRKPPRFSKRIDLSHKSSLVYVRVLNIRLMNVNFSYAAIKYDNIDVFGYTAWSLLDGFEWQHAYNIRRGLFYVDFKSEKKERIPKSSARYYKQIIRENGFFPKESTPSLQAQFSCDFSWGITESVLKVSVKIPKRSILAGQFSFTL